MIDREIDEFWRETWGYPSLAFGDRTMTSTGSEEGLMRRDT
jgi:hypothetical protein